MPDEGFERSAQGRLTRVGLTAAQTQHARRRVPTSQGDHVRRLSRARGLLRVRSSAAGPPVPSRLRSEDSVAAAAAIIEQAHAGHKLSDKGINPTRFVRGLSVSSSTQPG